MSGERPAQVQLPDREFHLRISTADRDRLLAAVNWDALRSLPNVIGCPDCADGGAEWIEVERYGTRVRVSFEFGAHVADIEDLVRCARDLRARLQP